MRPLNEAVWNTLHSKHEFCRLCFSSVAQTALSMQDEVITKHNPEISKELVTILSLVLGSEVSEGFSPQDRVCDECVRMAITSYSFIITSKENSQNFANALECITSCLETTEQMDSCRSLFLSINVSESTSTTFYDSKMCSNKTKDAVLKQFKNLIEPRRRKKAEIDDTEFTDTTNFLHLSSEIKETEKYLVQKMEDGRRKYICKLCLKEFNRSNNAVRHNISVHGGDKPDKKIRNEVGLMCETCGKLSKNKHALQTHELSHGKGKQCPKCKKYYKTNVFFSNHLCIPLAADRPKLDKKFICDHCDARFGRKTTLLLHIKFEHGNGVPHVCNYCKKKFYAFSSLKLHTITHTKVKNYKCQLCDGQYVTKASLLYHIRTHTGEKPYKCKLCDQYFLSASRRADHVRIHHMAPSISCSVCNKYFKAYGQLNKHKRRHFNPNSRLYIGNKDSD